MPMTITGTLTFTATTDADYNTLLTRVTARSAVFDITSQNAGTRTITVDYHPPQSAV